MNGKDLEGSRRSYIEVLSVRLPGETGFPIQNDLKEEGSPSLLFSSFDFECAITKIQEDQGNWN
jgi:hypothetical protein